MDITKSNGMSDSPEKGFMLIPEESLGPCMNCGEGTLIKYCRQYNGYMGKCTACGINWRES